MNCFFRNIFYLLTIVIFHYNASGQNLCPNPGFEQTSACPTGSGELNLALPWNGAGSLTDLFSNCHVNAIPPGCNDVSVPTNFAGTSSTHGGSNYAGFYTKKVVANQRNYLQAPLNSPLVSGQIYRVAAFFRRSTHSGYATNNIGISFSTAAISQTGGTFIPIVPQIEMSTVIADTSTWTSFAGFYSAVGGEAFITIGNFRSDAATNSFNFSVAPAPCAAMNLSAFYFADDITVTPISEQLAVTGDTLICTGQTTTLTGTTNTTGWWSQLSTPNDTIVSVNNMITVAPLVTTTYLWNGIQSSVSVNVSVTPAPIVNLPVDTTICQGDSFVLNALNTGSTYQWSTGATTAQISVLDSGTYIVTVNNGSCAIKDTFLLGLLLIPSIPLPPVVTICPDNLEAAVLDGGTGASFLWTPTLDTISTISVYTEGLYSVTVTQANGCSRIGSTQVNALCEETIFFPGAFSPNSDGKNDLFYGDGTNFSEYSIKIFNRWGQLIFESSVSGIGGAWNGTFENGKAPSGIYSYFVGYTALKSNGKIKKEVRQGHFTLIR